MSTESARYKGYFGDQVSVFLLHAHELSRAASALEMPKFGLARGLLLGQALELSLKAWLVGLQQQRGQSVSATVDEVRKKFGHNLERLWQASAREGLPLEDSLPYWADHVAGAHDKPYANRYPACNDAFLVPSLEECHFVTGLVEEISTRLNKRLEFSS